MVSEESFCKEERWARRMIGWRSVVSVLKYRSIAEVIILGDRSDWDRSRWLFVQRLLVGNVLCVGLERLRVVRFQ